MRVSSLRALLAASTCLAGSLLAGCTRVTLTPLDTAVAESYVQLLRTHRFDQIQGDMTLDLRFSEPRDQLASMSSLFPAVQPISVKVVGASTEDAPNFHSADLTLEYQFPDKWLLADVTTQRANGTRSLTALSVTPIPDSLEHSNRFSLWDKTELEYDALALGMLSILLSLYAFVVCLSSRLHSGKWFWLLVTLIGIGGFDVNWTTGEYVLTPWIFRVPAAGGSAPVYGPAMVYVALPIGALIFLALRKRLTDRSPAAYEELRDYEQPPFGLALLWHRAPGSLPRTPRR